MPGVFPWLPCLVFLTLMLSLCTLLVEGPIPLLSETPLPLVPQPIPEGAPGPAGVQVGLGSGG